MSLVSLVVLVYLCMSDIIAEDLCVGLTCYNGGTKSYDRGVCKCHCSEGFTGLLCDIEIKPSNWPHGPYWLVMPTDGCPETRAQGWEKAYIEFSANVTESDERDFLTYRSRQQTNITGMFGPDTYKINFCYKSVRHEKTVPWPDWDYAIFGVENDCPSEMTEHVLNLTVYSIYNVITDGPLPDVTISTQGQNTEMKFVLCVHDRRSKNASNISLFGKNPFILVQHPNVSFSEIDGISVTDTLFPLPAASSQLDLGYYIPNSREESGPLNKIEIDKDCHAVFERTVSVDIMEECDTSIYQNLLKDDCFDTAWIRIDLMQTIRIDGVVLYSDFNANYFDLENLLKEANVDIFIGDVRWDNVRKFAHRCSHSTLFVPKVHLFGAYGSVIYKCSRSYEGRFITFKVDRHTPSAELEILTSDEFRMYAISCQLYAATSKPLLPCNSDLGMSSFVIEDFQLSASSSFQSFVPSNARPKLTGWQALKSDKLSFIQVDLLVVTVINGLVVHNWYELDHTSSTPTLAGAAAFRVQYGIVSHNMTFYGRKEAEFIIDTNTLDKPQQFVFYNHFLARFVRFYPRPFQDKRPGLKFEILGCRIFGFPSLSCKGSKTSIFVNASKMYIPYSATFELNINQSTTCDEECDRRGDRCTGIVGVRDDDGTSLCQLVLRNYSSRYTMLENGYKPTVNQTIEYTTMKICRDGVFRIQYTALNIDLNTFKDNGLYLPSSASKNITSLQTLTCYAYPFHYNTNYFRRWSINVVNGFIGLQFTDIDLKENTTNILEKHAGNAYCYEGLFLHHRDFEISTMFDGQVKQLYNRLFWFTIDSSFNRRQSYIGSETSRIEMVYRACPREHYEQNNVRGFRVHVQSKDIRPCMTKAYNYFGRCHFDRMEITSSTFNDIDHAGKDLWEIQLGFTYQFLRMYLEEITISCSSENRLKSPFLINGVDYCRLEVSTLPIIIRGKEKVKIEFELKPGCLYRYMEGFSLKYDFGIIPFSTQFDFLRKIERSELAPRLEEGCFDEFKKCYLFRRNYANKFSWNDLFSLCKARQMSLLTLMSKREMNFIKGYIAIENPHTTINVFIGLYRHLDAEENSYEQWINGRPLTFTDWKEHPTFLTRENQCTVMTFSELNTTSWKRVSCNSAYSPVSAVCERPYTGGEHAVNPENDDGDADDEEYDVRIIESNNNSTGLIYITTSCMCKSENLAVTWFYHTGDNETFIVRQKTQPGYFEQFRPCHRKCKNTHAYSVSTGFYFKEGSDGIPVQLRADITNSFNPADKKNVYTSMLYKLTDPRQMVKVKNNVTLWFCGNGEYISFLAKCNGYPECSNQMDETGCTSTCDDNQFRCTDGRCIHVSQICDSSNDCLDSSDEYCDLSDWSITNALCSIPTQFKCADGGRCLSEDMRCDGYKHCLDGSDERNCDNCSNNAFKCFDKTCIPKVQRCDKYLDCNDGTDEEDCSSERNRTLFRFRTCDDIWAIGHTESGLYKIGSNEIRCEFGMNYTKLVALHPDWGCTTFDSRYYFRYKVEPVNPIRDAVENGYTCTLKVSKTKSRVLQMADRADGALNSSTYSAVYYQMEFKINKTSVEYIGPDGYFFDYTTFYFGATFTRDISISVFYRYPYLMDPIECIKDTVRPIPKLFCDPVVQPVSQEDACIYTTDYRGDISACRSMEHLKNCELYVCSPGYYKCPRSYCIPQKLVCDGITHCIGNEDETGCQWCNSTTGTVFIAAMDDRRRLGTDKYFYSSFRVAKQLNSKLMLFEKTTRGDIQEYDVHIFETLFTKITIRCILKTTDERNTTCMDDIISKLKASNTSKALIWIRSTLPSPEEKIFPSILKSIDRLWTIIINESEQYPLKIQRESTTEILLRNMAMLRTVLPDVFADYCNVSRSLCADNFRCSFSRVCISWQQVCDSIYDCPHQDDEQFCDFECPSNCTCEGYSVSCQQTYYNPLSELSLTTRKANISNSIFQYKNLDLEKHLPYLSLLFASNCKIKVLNQGTLQGSKNLRVLDVSYNLISIIRTGAFVYLKKLAVLNLKENRYLTILEPDCFNGIKVSNLEIKYTKLRTLDANVFSGLNLKMLDISENNINLIKEFAFANLSVDLLRMEGNPITTFDNDLFAGIKSIKIIKASAYKICCVRPFEFPEDNCWPRKDEFSSCEDLMRNTTLQALLWTIGLLSLFGNILSMIYRVIFDSKRLKIGYGIFVTNLAIADFLMGVYLLIIAVADKIFRNRYIEVDEYWRESFWCNMAGLLSTISSEMSVMLICCITVDRILVIKFPFGTFKFTPFSALITVAVCWLLSCILAILPLCGFEYFGTSFYGRSPVCLALPLTRERTQGWQYSVFLFIGFNFILFLLIALGQLLIYVEIKKTAKVKRQMNVARSNDLAVARNLLLLVLTDFLCWFPIGCMGIMALRGNYVPLDVYAWTAILILPINSAMNPFLYTFSTIFGRKKFNPDVEEQSRLTFSKEIATAALAVLIYFAIEGGRGRFSIISLTERLQERRMGHRDKMIIIYQLAKCLQCLHCNEMVLGRINADSVLLRLSSSNKSVSMIHLKVPQICKSKTEYAENIYQLGCLVEQLFF